MHYLNLLRTQVETTRARASEASVAEAESSQALRDTVSRFRDEGGRELEAASHELEAASRELEPRTASRGLEEASHDLEPRIASHELEAASHELDAARPRRMLGEVLAAQTQQWERAVGVVEAAGTAHASAVARFTQLQVSFLALTQPGLKPLSQRFKARFS